MSQVVLDGPLALALLVAALAGVVSFASPCVLPLVPGFLGYVTGMVPGEERRGTARLVGGAVLFVLGFSAVFVATGVLVGGVGVALQGHQGVLLRVGGVVVAALGLVLLLRPAGWQPRWRPAAGLLGAPLLGVVFGLGFSACTGPVLAAIQALGASLLPGEGAVGRGAALSVAYSLGLGLPFVLIAAGVGWTHRASQVLRDRHRLLQVVGGVLLVVLGLLMVAGVWETLTAWVQTRLTSTFRTAL